MNWIIIQKKKKTRHHRQTPLKETLNKILCANTEHKMLVFYLFFVGWLVREMVANMFFFPERLIGIFGQKDVIVVVVFFYKEKHEWVKWMNASRCLK